MWWTFDQPVEKRRGRDGAVPATYVACEQWPLYHLPVESVQFSLFRIYCFTRIDFLPLDLQALLDIYLLDNIDEAAKHAIVSLDV